MRVCVLLFAAHREIMGRSRLEVELPADSTVNDLFGQLEQQEALMSETRQFTTFAVNREMVEPSTVLHAGDEVALLQPVSGGCA